MDLVVLAAAQNGTELSQLPDFLLPCGLVCVALSLFLKRKQHLWAGFTFAFLGAFAMLLSVYVSSFASNAPASRVWMVLFILVVTLVCIAFVLSAVAMIKGSRARDAVEYER